MSEFEAGAKAMRVEIVLYLNEELHRMGHGHEGHAYVEAVRNYVRDTLTTIPLPASPASVTLTPHAFTAEGTVPDAKDTALRLARMATKAAADFMHDLDASDLTLTEQESRPKILRNLDAALTAIDAALSSPPDKAS